VRRIVLQRRQWPGEQEEVRSRIDHDQRASVALRFLARLFWQIIGQIA
jgi:hypothetical protein